MPDNKPASLSPKPDVNYRQGGDVCGVCTYFVPGTEESGTCTKVEGPIHSDDVCDLFQRKGKGDAGSEVKSQARSQAEAMAGRGLISDQQMAKMPSGY